jgi:outer membrane protein assembly factor BamB
LNPEDGAVLWTYVSQARFESSPVVVGDRVFVGTTGGKVLALDLQAGELNWEFVVGSDIVAAPSVTEGKLIIGATDGTLYCFGGKVD